jgi:hypothetical protein
MKKFKTGLVQAVSSVVLGLVLTAAVGYLAKNGWLPDYSVIILSVFNIIANLLTLRKMRGWGIFYTLGWLGGSLLFKLLGLMDTLDFYFNVLAPCLIFCLRIGLWLGGSRATSRKKRKQIRI